MDIKNKKLIGLLFVIFAPLILILSVKSPSPQDLSYHNFADGYSLLGIPNFHNVISNLPFILFGLLGVIDYFKYRERYSFSWLIFYVGVILVAPGSVYYHLEPNNNTLVWDRVPMTFGFMGVVSSIFVDVFKIKYEKLFLTGLLLLGVYTIIHWIQFDDLRLYGWLQAVSIIIMLYMAIVYKKSHLSMKHLIIAITFYGLAKLTETYDELIFESLSYSGHSLKHILAGLAVFTLIKMKRDYVHSKD